jgi:glycine/D-amino acid oxidase-like deaminating enzyme
MRVNYGAVVIGGGFYGCFIAVHLARLIAPVLVVEREDALLSRASYVNQARLHNGYHYPRSFRTAASSRQNLSAFRNIFEESVDASFEALYCVAREGSKVSRAHFERFCRTLGMPLREAPQRLQRLFDRRRIDAVYAAEEFAFDAVRLREALRSQLAAAQVEVRMRTEAREVSALPGGGIRVSFVDEEEVSADWVFNCTYSALNRLAGLCPTGAPRMKHQLTEVALVEVPDELRFVGVTIIDGPFFSTMPFPARKLHSFTHVRYTPHFTWEESARPELDPAHVLRIHAKQSNFPWMVRDARRYMPCARDIRHVDSLFEVKTLLLQTDVDDARPIALHRDASLPRVVSILGGKIDNVFDVLQFIDTELDLV